MIANSLKREKLTHMRRSHNCIEYYTEFERVSCKINSKVHSMV